MCSASVRWLCNCLCDYMQIFAERNCDRTKNFSFDEFVSFGTADSHNRSYFCWDNQIVAIPVETIRMDLWWCCNKWICICHLVCYVFQICYHRGSSRSRQSVPSAALGGSKRSSHQSHPCFLQRGHQRTGHAVREVRTVIKQFLLLRLSLSRHISPDKIGFIWWWNSICFQLRFSVDTNIVIVSPIRCHELFVVCSDRCWVHLAGSATAHSRRISTNRAWRHWRNITGIM